MGREIKSTEPLNIILNDSDTRSRKSNQHYTKDKTSNLNDTVTSKIKEAQTEKDIDCRRFDCKKYRGVETQ